MAATNTGGNPWYQSQIGSAFNPQAPYSQDQIQQNVNRSVASEQRSNSMPALLKQFNNPSSGFSLSPANASRATGPLANSISNVNSMRAGIPLQYGAQNAQSMLGQQNAQEGSALQTAGLYGQQQNQQFGQGIQGLQSGSQLLQMLGFGGLM